MNEYTYLIRYRKQGEAEINNIRYTVKATALSDADWQADKFKEELGIYSTNNGMNYSSSNGDFFYKQLLEVIKV